MDIYLNCDIITLRGKEVVVKKGIVILGPTGVGKTELSIELGKELGGEIISADSAQVYQGMDIGTAKITKEEMDGVPHHLLDIVKPIKKYSVGEYQKDVNKVLEELEEKKITPILVGGTGLYINSITNGLAELPEPTKELRERLMGEDKETLYKILKEKDPESAEKIHKNNKRRVERALEVIELTGEKFSILRERNIKRNNFDFIKIGLERDRDELYARINLRVELMMKEGLEEEVRDLYEKYGEVLLQINVIGYSELIRYFKGELTREEAIEDIKKNSRHYAKRQFTWFKNDPDVIWYDVSKESTQGIIDKIKEHLIK